MSCTCIIHSILKQKSRKTASCLVKVFTRMGDFHSINEDRLVSWSGLLPRIIPRKYDVSLRRLLVFVPMNVDYMCIWHSVYMYNCQIKIKNNTRLNTFKAHKLFLKYTPHRIYRLSIFSMSPCYTKPSSLLETFSSGVSMDSPDAFRVKGLLMFWISLVPADHLWQTSEEFLLNRLILFFSLHHTIKCWKTPSFHPHTYSNTH